MAEQEERRARAAPRVARVAGGTTGAAIGIVLAWCYQEYTGRTMAPEVAAALGGLASTLVICVQDIRAIFFMVINRRKSR